LNYKAQSNVVLYNLSKTCTI